MKAQTLIKTRQLLKLTQVEFAQLLGVSTRTLWGWEHGQCKPSGALIQIADMLVLSPGYAPLMLTVYWWLCWRNYLLVKQGTKQVKISWAGVSKQLGTTKFMRALKGVLLRYSEARGNVLLYPNYLLVRAFKFSNSEKSKARKNEHLVFRIDNTLRAALAMRAKTEHIPRHKRSELYRQLLWAGLTRSKR